MSYEFIAAQSLDRDVESMIEITQKIGLDLIRDIEKQRKFEELLNARGLKSSFQRVAKSDALWNQFCKGLKDRGNVLLRCGYFAGPAFRKIIQKW